jgi:hypothetical protein
LEPARVAHDLYAIAIPKLLWRGEEEEALRQFGLVRTYGRRAKVAKRYYEWTRTFELEGLIKSGKVQAAWRLMGKQLREKFPRWARQPVEKRVGRMHHFVRFSEVTVAYWSGRLLYATRAMEAYLAWSMDLFNGEEHPGHYVRTTLFHLYRANGRTLADWPLWKTWVGKLHPGLFDLTGIKRPDLAADAGLMHAFHERLQEEERERRPARVTFGQKDLLEPKEKVLARQAKVRDLINEPPSEHAQMMEEKRAKYFPWLEPRM